MVCFSCCSGHSLGEFKVFFREGERERGRSTCGACIVFKFLYLSFSDGDLGRYIAAFAVVINGLRVLALGFGVLKDDATVKAMTRDGNPE